MKSRLSCFWFRLDHADGGAAKPPRPGLCQKGGTDAAVKSLRIALRSL